jgi:hypothetical protein
MKQVQRRRGFFAEVCLRGIGKYVANQRTDNGRQIVAGTVLHGDYVEDGFEVVRWIDAHRDIHHMQKDGKCKIINYFS